MKHLQEPTDALPIAHLRPSCTSPLRRAGTRIRPGPTLRLGISSLVPLAAAAVTSIALAVQAQASGIALTTYGSTPYPNGPGLSPPTIWGTDFATTTGDATTGVGPVGILPLKNHKMLVTNIDGDLRLFPYDTPQPPTISQPTQLESGGVLLNNYGTHNAAGLAVLIGNPNTYYMTQQSAGRILQIDPSTANGNPNNGPAVVVASGIPVATGIIAFPPTGTAFPTHVGHLFVSEGAAGIVEVDPQNAVPPYAVVYSGVADGMAFTPTGQFLMVASSGGFKVIDMASTPPQLVYTVPITGGDGIALGMGPAMLGKAYVNTNFGEVWEVQYDVHPGAGSEFEPPSSPVVNLVASGGTRGDFIAVDSVVYCGMGTDSAWPSMLITQSSSIVRMDPPDAGFFGPPYSIEAPIFANQSFCSGDGTLATNCPCFNFGLPGHGCDNSIASGGALLTISGSTVPDTMSLLSTGELPSVTSVFLQGTSNITNGVVFGDGVRCIGGSLKRLAAKNAVNGAVFYPDLNDLSITARSAQLGDSISPGSSRYYQVYYRDPIIAFCGPSSSTFNVSSAIRIDW